MSDAEKAGKEFAKLVRILDVLRGENGCPWDKEQDEKSIVDYFLEEVYEVVDAIYDSNSRSVVEELGDVLMEIVFLSRIFEEKNKFKISEVIVGINHKMVRRHPHVFGPKKINSPEKVSAVWRKQKNEEKKRKSLYEGLCKSTPALLSSLQIGLKASVYGFDWDSAKNTLQKVKEEIWKKPLSLERKRMCRKRPEISFLRWQMYPVILASTRKSPYAVLMLNLLRGFNILNKD